jgi:hypothetical protein
MVKIMGCGGLCMSLTSTKIPYDASSIEGKDYYYPCMLPSVLHIIERDLVEENQFSHIGPHGTILLLYVNDCCV